MFIGNIKHDAFITKIKLNCVSFAPHSRIFLDVRSSISTATTTVRKLTASLKFYGSTKLESSLHVKMQVGRKIRCEN